MSPTVKCSRYGFAVCSVVVARRTSRSFVMYTAGVLRKSVKKWSTVLGFKGGAINSCVFGWGFKGFQARPQEFIAPPLNPNTVDHFLTLFLKTPAVYITKERDVLRATTTEQTAKPYRLHFTVGLIPPTSDQFTIISLRIQHYFTVISLLFHYYFTISSLLCLYDFTVISLICHNSLTISSLWFHYYFTSISLRFHWYFTSISLLVHY
jgi:hypothetical protein